MGTDAFARQALHQLLEAAEVPTVLDADALTLVALEPDLLTDTRAPMVLTPHPGEMGRLLGLSVSEVQSNRIDLARSAAARWGQTVILKGFGTLIAGADGTMALNRTGTPALAKAGTGDVLSGLIGALLSRRIPVFDAARAGVWLHGRAGEAAESVRGENGVLASDVIEQIHTVMAS
jgi:NAD(P)H-hydrate epimerase